MSSFSINTNLAALIARQNAAQANQGLQKTLGRLSTGLRINQPQDDAAGLAIADGLRGQIRTLVQSARNAGDGISLIQTADAALAQVLNILTRASTLLAEAANSPNSAQSTAIGTELTELYQEIDRIGEATNFNGAQVFTDLNQNIFIGDNKNATNNNRAVVFLRTQELSIARLPLSVGIIGAASALRVTIANGATAQAMLSQAELAIDDVSRRRGELGAKASRLEQVTNVIEAQVQNLTAAESRIRDADAAEEVANLTKFQILTQSGIAALAQANQANLSVLALLGG